MLTGALLLFLSPGCRACPGGQDVVCDGSECSECGDVCLANSHCPTGEVCACRAYGDGVCVTPEWAALHGARTDSCGSSGGGECGGGCPGGTTCVTGMGCLPVCATASECSTGCCAPLTGGGRACAPSSYCSGGTCPAGTFPQYAGGPCVPPTPSSCPNGWAVCNCPDYHGVWCHPDCDDWRRGEGGPGTYCGGDPC